MAIPAHLYIDGIEGDCQVAGREGSMEVFAFGHEVRLPTDRDTGGITGTRKHEPFRIVKAYDKASPLIYKAVCEGMTLAKVRVDWFKIDEDGAETMYFQHVLEKVRVSSVKPFMYNVKDKQYERYVHMEEVSFRYEKINWIITEGGIEYSDSWLENR
ncbi:MAG: type VI secretion system tube protein TssD [Chitinispirillia bacterium]|jgi:type VI secretion system secreted protein Hcp